MIEISTIITWITISLYLYLFITIYFLLLDERDTSSTIAWLLFFFIFPIIGLLIYILAGRNWRIKPKGFMFQTHMKVLLSSLVHKQKEYQQHIAHNVDAYKVMKLVARNANSLITLHNNIELITSGEQKFNLLLKDIAQAKHSIHMEYFTWYSDEQTQRIQQALIQKAMQGVEVRILYDTYGSFGVMKRAYKKTLQKAGVHIYPYFNFLSPFRFHTLNYRNHRKIVVIDGCIGYTGGMNLGKEYVDGGKYGYWRDLHMRMQGDSVLVLQEIFAISWYNTTKQRLFAQQYFPKQSIKQKLPIQITTSGPDSEWESIKQLFFTLIANADTTVYIHTPYFIPDQSMLMALKTAALSGIDVRIIMTGVPDKRIPFWAAHTYFKSLLKAGVKIYLYQKGFMHAKSMSIDGTMCCMGSANFDSRSFHLNYELATIIYDTGFAKQVQQAFIDDIAHCKELSMDDKMSVWAQLRNGCMRLLAPIL
ncbi:MAG: cardiolipin synthase [Candidatus Woesearchaeota archaeon]